MSRIRVKVNAFCVGAVMLGIVSLLLPWVVFSGGASSSDQYVVQDVLLGGAALGTAFTVACSFFIGGLLLSLITPAAGFVELAGALGALIFFPSAYKDFEGQPAIYWGALLGFGSAILVILSLYYPLGPGYGSFARRKYVGQANRMFTISRLDSTAKFRVNLLCLAGALLALAAIGGPWFTHEVSTAHPLTTAYDSHNLFMVLDQSFGAEAMFAAIAFIAGTAVAFVTPLGGVAQVVGIVWFWQVRAGIVGTFTSSDWIDRNYFDSGFYLGIAAAVAVTASMFIPVGIGYVLRHKTLGARLVIWGEPTAHL